MMLKKIFGLLVIGVVAIGLAACGETITIDIEDLNVDVIEGDTYQIEFDTNDSMGLQFESGNTAILTVSATGLVTAVAEGETTVTISSKDDPEIKVTVTVKVSKNYVLTVPSNSITVKVGESKDVIYTSNGNVTFTSANTDIFTVSAAGLVTGVAEGTANLTIQSVSDTSLSVVVSIQVRKIVTLETDSMEETLWVGGTVQLSHESNADVTFETEDQLIASVTPTGLVTGTGVGEVMVTIRSAYDTSVFEEVLVKVYGQTQTIMITGQDLINVGSEKSLEIEVSPDLSYSFVTW
ncbi:MAG: Ig-like domain-containing protein, partial [Firmicutes bacterium]|nr:Ig-like domain-containing protein [Bacillota bacterium]